MRTKDHRLGYCTLGPTLSLGEQHGIHGYRVLPWSHSTNETKVTLQIQLEVQT